MTDKDKQPEITPEKNSITLRVKDKSLVITRDMTIEDLQKGVEANLYLKQELDLLIEHDAIFGTNLDELVQAFKDAHVMEKSEEDESEYVRRNVINAIFDAFTQRNMIENTGNDDSNIVPFDKRPKE